MLFHIAYTLALGAAAGWIAFKIMKGPEVGWVRNILVGIMGSIVGGIVFSIVGLHSSGILGNMIVSVVGACLFLWLNKRYHF